MAQYEVYNCLDLTRLYLQCLCPWTNVSPVSNKQLATTGTLTGKELRHLWAPALWLIYSKLNNNHHNNDYRFSFDHDLP